MHQVNFADYLGWVTVSEKQKIFQKSIELGKTKKITWEEISSCLIPEKKKQLYMPTDGGGG